MELSGRGKGRSLLELEVLVIEAFAVDGLAARALSSRAKSCRVSRDQGRAPVASNSSSSGREKVRGEGKSAPETHVVPREIPTLQHEARDDAVEAAALVPEPLRAGAQRAEVGRAAGRHVVVELEDDASGRAYFVCQWGASSLTGRRAVECDEEGGGSTAWGPPRTAVDRHVKVYVRF